MKILVILPRFPYPLEKGDKLRAYHQIRVLSATNDIYLFCLSHSKVSQEQIDCMSQFCKEICMVRISPVASIFRVLRNLFTVRSLQIGYWDSSKARKQYRRFESRVAPDVIYAQMIRTIKYPAHSAYPKVLDYQDALSMNFERRMSGAHGLRYFLFHYEFKMLRSAEYNAFNIFDALTIISERDSEAIPHRQNCDINILRNGVDFDYFSSSGLDKDVSVVFCGNMQYKPNIDAARYLVDEIMPLVWKKCPEAKVMLAGATPTSSVRQLAGPKVTVTGFVDDIRPCYDRSLIFLAPMRIGSGLQNKLLEAMAMGVPCVTTPLANEALGATDGKDLLVGSSANELADHIVHLLENPQLRQILVDNAGTFVRDNFSWEAEGCKLNDILARAIQLHATKNEDRSAYEEELENE